LVTAPSWFAQAVRTSEAPWRATYAWESIELELRGPAGVTDGPYVEGIALTADHGYVWRAAAAPWQVACLAPTSAVRIINGNDVIDLKLGATVACPGVPGPDRLDVCYASEFDVEPAPPCSPGVTGTLDGNAAPNASTRSLRGNSDRESFTIDIAQYKVRIPVGNRSLDSTAVHDFAGGLVALEREGAFDVYCAVAGRAEERRITLTGLTKVASCGASVTPVESAQVCRWDFTREPQP
jgi:hypothetical protein